MSPAAVSLLALLAAAASSLLPRVNAGLLAMALAAAASSYAGLPAGEWARGFPQSLFLLLAGVTWLFSLARANGTLERAAGWAVGLAGGRAALLGPVFFALAAALSALGAGNIPAVALLAPLAMAAAGRAGMSALLMTIMLVTGANAGAFSPLAMTGALANGLLARHGVEMRPWADVFWPAFAAQTLVAAGSWLALGGWRLAGRAARAAPPHARVGRVQGATLAAVAAYMLGAGALGLEPASLALGLGGALCLAGAADARRGVARVPWGTILMVCGISQLVAVAEAAGGLSLVSASLSRWAQPWNAAGVLAFVAGLASTYSSSSGVVLPAFLPMVPELSARLGVEAASLAAAVNVGSHLVDVSPLSTLGALCVASAPAHEDRERLFRRLLAFGLAMSAAGGLLGLLLFR